MSKETFSRRVLPTLTLIGASGFLLAALDRPSTGIDLGSGPPLNTEASPATTTPVIVVTVPPTSTGATAPPSSAGSLLHHRVRQRLPHRPCKPRSHHHPQFAVPRSLVQRFLQSMAQYRFRPRLMVKGWCALHKESFGRRLMANLFGSMIKRFHY